MDESFQLKKHNLPIMVLLSIAIVKLPGGIYNISTINPSYLMCLQQAIAIQSSVGALYMDFSNAYEPGQSPCGLGTRHGSRSLVVELSTSVNQRPDLGKL